MPLHSGDSSGESAEDCSTLLEDGLSDERADYQYTALSGRAIGRSALNHEASISWIISRSLYVFSVLCDVIDIITI